MCCSSTQNTFAWIGAILVNIGFISLIIWGANSLWPVGFLLSAIYTFVLLCLARWMEQSHPTTTGYRGVQDVELTENSHQTIVEDGEDDQTDSNITPKVPILVSLLYGLGVISLGVTGFFLPVNLLPDCGNPSSYRPSYVWQTNLSSLPKEVRDWAFHDVGNYQDSLVGATFGFVESTNITLFQGVDFSNKAVPNIPCLWTAQASKPPLKHGAYTNPSPFITVTENAVCFQSQAQAQPGKMKKKFVIYCSDGIVFRKEIFKDAISSSHKPRLQHEFTLRNFKTVQGILWFKESLYYHRVGGESGTLVYSLDPESMLSTLHSNPIPYVPEKNDSCHLAQVERQRAVLSLFASAIPMMILSVVLWKRKQIPSMGITSYVSLSLIYITIQLAIVPDPERFDSEPPFQWWFTTSGLIWFLISTHLLLSISTSSLPIQRNHREPIRAGLVTSAIAYSWGSSMLIMSGDLVDHDTLGWWILWNIFVFLPLILSGAAIDSVGLLAMGGLGFLADAFRIAALVDSTVFFFLVFCLTGLAVGILGYYFCTRYQPVIQEWCQVQTKSINEWLLSMYHQHRQRETVNNDTTDTTAFLS